MLASCFFSFVLGSVPFGWLLARAWGKVDVRAKGSGNIGATNVSRIAGRRLGFATLVLDGLKGFFPTWVASAFCVPAALGADARALFVGVVGFCAVAGHCLTPWLGFRGGKGVATGMGMLWAVAPVLAADGLLAFAVAFLATRIASVASLTAVLVVAAAVVVVGVSLSVAVPLWATLLLIVWRHKDNLGRLARREELRP